MDRQAERVNLMPKGLHRTIDHTTSIDAAKAIQKHLSDLQQKVLDAFRCHEELTDGELESLPQFSQCAPSTVRKRRGELVGRYIQKTAKRRKGQAVWSILLERPQQKSMFDTEVYL